MSISSRASSLQSYNLALFRGALHPEFFRIEGRRPLAHGEYDFESWIFRGGHVFRFEYNGLCITEVVGDDVDELPDRGHVTTLPCAGERDHDAEFADRIAYMTSMQTETLTGHLYLSTFTELLEHGQREGALMCTWSDDGRGESLSMIDAQRFAGEIHLQSYHMRSDCGLVLRTQTIFQIKTP